MFNTLMTLINACENDVDFFEEGKTIQLTICDLEGFDDDWNAVMRDYVNPDAVDALLDWLNANCIFKTYEFYTIYFFNDFTVQLGFSSFDIP